MSFIKDRSVRQCTWTCRKMRPVRPRKLVRKALQNAHHCVKQQNRVGSSLSPRKRPIPVKPRIPGGYGIPNVFKGLIVAPCGWVQISTKVPFRNTSPTPKNVLIVLATSNSALSRGLPLRVRALLSSGRIRPRRRNAARPARSANGR